VAIGQERLERLNQPSLMLRRKVVLDAERARPARRLRRLHALPRRLLEIQQRSVRGRRLPEERELAELDDAVRSHVRNRRVGRAEIDADG
jgi:hypothetical protein